MTPSKTTSVNFFDFKKGQIQVVYYKGMVDNKEGFDQLTFELLKLPEKPTNLGAI